MEDLSYSMEKASKPRGKKEETDNKGSVLLKCLKFTAEKWNPYDTFPEENGYHTPVEVLEFFWTLIRD